MPSKALDFARQELPFLENETDKDVALFAASEFPFLLEQDEEFAAEVKAFNEEGEGGIVDSTVDFFEDLGRGIGAGVADIGTAAYSVGQAYFTGVTDYDMSLYDITPLGLLTRAVAPESSKQARNYVADTMKELADEGADIAEGIVQGGDPDSLTTEIARAATSILPVLPAGAMAIPVVGAQSFGSAYNQAQRGYKEQGLTDEEAARASMLPALGHGTLDMALAVTGGKIASKLGLTNIEAFKKVAGNKSFKEGVDKLLPPRASGGFKYNDLTGKFSKIKSVTGGALVEGGLEEAPSAFVGSYIIARNSYDPNVTLDQAVQESVKSFYLGTAIGGGAGALQLKVHKSAQEAAKRETIRSIAPATAAKLDQKDSEAAEAADAASRVLPEGEANAETEVVDIRQSQKGTAPARKAVINKLTKNGKVKMPSWWDKYEGTPDPEGSPTDAPTGVRYADQDTVDRFIENEEAKNDLSKVSVEKNKSGDWEARKDGELIAIEENEAEASEAGRSSVLNNVNKATKKRIKDFKKLTRDLKRIEDLEVEKQKIAAELEQEKKIQEGSLRRVETEVEVEKDGKTVKEKATRIEEVGPEERLPDVTDEDITFVAKSLGIREEDLPYSLGRDSDNNINITPEMVSELRSAPEAGVTRFLQQAQSRRDAEQLKSDFDAVVVKGEELANLEKEQAQAEAEAANAAIIAGQTLKVREDRAELSRATEEATTPDTVQLAEFTEEKLESGELTTTEESILNRLQDRKADLIADSVQSGESQQQNFLQSITDIDNQIANILSAEVRTPTPVTAEQLTQLQQAYGMSAPDVETDSQPTIKIGNTEIRITDGTASSPTPAASPLSQRAQSAATQVASARFQATRVAEASAKANAAIAERKLQQEREANLQAQRDRRDQPQEIEQQQVLDKVSEALSRLEKRFKGLLGLSEIQITQQDSGAGVYSLASDGVTNTILVDPKRLTETMRESKDFSLEKALEEELIHNLDGQALQAEYTRQISNGELSPSVTLKQFIQKQYSDVANGMTPEERSVARRLYGNDFKDDIHMAQEFVRQLIQKRHSKTITEESYRKGAIRKLLEMLSRAFQTMSLSKPLNAHVKNLESFLERTYKKEMSDAKTAKEKQKVKDEREFAKLVESETANDHNNALNAIDNALSRNNSFVTGSNDYQLARDKAYDDWRSRYEEGKPTNVNLIAFNAVGKVLRENKTQKRGGDFDVTSLDRLAEEGIDVGGDLTPAGESMTEFLDLQKSKIGLTDQEFDYLQNHFFNNTPKVKVAEIYGLNKSRITQIENAALTKIRNRVINDPEFLGELIQTTSNPDIFTQSQGPIGAAKPAVIDKALADPKTKGVYKILSEVGDFGRRAWRFFDSSGGLIMPSDANADKQLNFKQKLVERDGYVNAVQGEIRLNNRKLTKAVKVFFGKKPTPENVALINNALGGDKTAIDALPKDITNVLSDMRQQIDGLSKYMISKGWVNGDLQQKITDNLGRYVARSYRIFDDADYASEGIAPEVLTRAEAYIEKQLIENGTDPLTAQVNAGTLVRDMLAKYSDQGGRAMFDSGKLGKTDLSLFMKKKDIAPEIRALLGEYKDPVMNYTRSVTRMANFVANHHLRQQMRDTGFGEVFFEESDMATRRKVGAFEEIPDTRSKRSQTDSPATYDPLAGLYCTKLTKTILDDYRAASSLMESSAFRLIAKLNVFTKTAATVASPMTQSRNLQGQPFFTLLNGHNPFAYRKAYKAFKAVMNDGFGSDKKLQAYFNKMSRLGLVGEEMTTAELRKAFEDHKDFADSAVSAEELLDKGLSKGLKAWKAAKGVGRSVVRIYRASDEIGKIANFEMELELLKPLYPDLSTAELETLAATRTRGAIPTYSELPPAIQALRMQPVVGPFMAFSYEAIRTQVNNINYAVAEFKRGGSSPNPMNPHTRYAARRIGGHLAVTAAFVGLAKALSSAFGVSEEEQKAIRSLKPDYEQKSQFLFWRGEDGTVNHVNLSFNNPYSTTTDPLVSLMSLSDQSADNFGEAALSKLIALAVPFPSGTILASAVIDLARNKTSYGTQVFNPEADISERIYKGAEHLGRAFNAGGLNRLIKRMIPAYLGKTLPSGEKPTLTKEIASELSGYKIRTTDYKDALGKASFGTSRRLRDASSLFSRVAGSMGTISEEEMSDAFRDANRSRMRIFRDAHLQTIAARAGGLSIGEIVRSLRAGNMAKADALAIVHGRYRPMDVSDSVIKRAREAGNTIPRRDLLQIRKEFLGMRIDDEDAE